MLCGALAGRGGVHLTKALQPRDGGHTLGWAAAQSSE